MAKLQIEIITPEKIIYSGSADQITLPTAAGQITVLPLHQPLISALTAGEIIIKENNNEIFMAVSTGLIQVHPDQVRILTDTAERVEDIDEARAQEAHQRAQELMAEKKDTVDYTQLSAKIEKELARLRVAKRRRHINQPHIEN
ncbi:MAG: ATP synthase F1 subunit epsilon [Candidatus Buchananbacteria bacterium]|nr:ATP synthase F1 subunit epsilon [Candidatus Buchananbacteria bacterium]